MEHCGDEVADRGITPAESARHNGVSWPVVYVRSERKRTPGSGTTRNRSLTWALTSTAAGSARWRRGEEIGEYVLAADRWHTYFYDLSGNQGMPGQVEGRTADDALAGRRHVGQARNSRRGRRGGSG